MMNEWVVWDVGRRGRVWGRGMVGSGGYGMAVPGGCLGFLHMDSLGKSPAGLG